MPTAGLLDRMWADGTLQTSAFTSVGYGSFGPVRGPGGLNFVYADTRYQSSGSFFSLIDAWLRLSQNPTLGDGGTCYGGSGGPNFLGGPESNLLVATTVRRAVRPTWTTGWTPPPRGSSWASSWRFPDPGAYPAGARPRKRRAPAGSRLSGGRPPGSQQRRLLRPGGGSVAGAPAGVGEHLPGHGHEAPLVPALAQGQPQHAVGAGVAYLAVGGR